MIKITIFNIKIYQKIIDVFLYLNQKEFMLVLIYQMIYIQMIYIKKINFLNVIIY